MKNGLINPNNARKFVEKNARMSLDSKQEKLPFLPFPKREEEEEVGEIGSTPIISNSYFQAFNFKARKATFIKKKR